MDREFADAQEAVFLAEHRLNQAPADNWDLIDAAIHELQAAEMRLSNLLRERRRAC